MNPNLKVELDKLTRRLAIEHKTSETFINVLISTSMLNSKLAILASMCRSNHINVKESCEHMASEVMNLAFVSGAMAGFSGPEGAAKIAAMYTALDKELQPLLGVVYRPAPSRLVS